MWHVFVGELWIDVSHRDVEKANHCDLYHNYERCMFYNSEGTTVVSNTAHTHDSKLHPNQRVLVGFCMIL